MALQSFAALELAQLEVEVVLVLARQRLLGLLLLRAQRLLVRLHDVIALLLRRRVVERLHIDMSSQIKYSTQNRR